MIEAVLLITLVIMGILMFIIFYLIKLSIDQRKLIHKLSDEMRNMVLRDLEVAKEKSGKLSAEEDKNLN